MPSVQPDIDLLKMRCNQCGQSSQLDLRCERFTCPYCGFVPRQPGEPTREPAQAEPVSDQPRPSLADVIGNSAAVRQIQTALEAHRARGGKSAFPHLLLAGVGGCGKTMLAEIIAREIGKPMRLAMGQQLNSPAGIGQILMGLKAGDVLFIDEIHGLKRPCQEAFYLAMESRILFPVARSGQPVPAPIKLPPFTLIGASTDEWALLPSLVQRFKYRVRLERLETDELARAIVQRAAAKNWTISDEAARMIAHRAHGTPRLALGLLEGCMDVALAGGQKSIDAMIVEATCEVWQLDALGLDRIERRYLELLDSAGGKPVRANVIASQLDNLSRRTVEMKIEPTLIWAGLIVKRADGRQLTEAGRKHLRAVQSTP